MEPDSMPMKDRPEKCCGGPYRESAKTALLSYAKRLRRKAHELEALADYLGDLPPEQDEALWGLVVRQPSP